MSRRCRVQIHNDMAWSPSFTANGECRRDDKTKDGIGAPSILSLLVRVLCFREQIQDLHDRRPHDDHDEEGDQVLAHGELVVLPGLDRDGPSFRNVLVELFCAILDAARERLFRQEEEDFSEAKGRR